MSRLRDEAEALAIAVVCGVCSVAEVVAWADHCILREDSPSGPLCDVAIARVKYPQDMANLLRRLPGSPEGAGVGRILASLLNDRLRADTSWARTLAGMLYWGPLAEVMEDPSLMELARWAWVGLDDAEEFGDLDERDSIVGEMTEVLGRVADEGGKSWCALTKSPEPRL